jgi:alanine racemase
MWPAIKANAYGHGMTILARELVRLGYRRLCVAHVSEAVALIERGLDADFLLLSPTLPEHSEAIVAHDCEAALCTLEMVDALDREAVKTGKRIAAHLMVDTGMGRVGIRPGEVVQFLEHCQARKGLWIRGLMSHFACADEADKAYSYEQIGQFRRVMDGVRRFGIEVHHMANSAAIFDLPEAHFDAVRPGIAMYGLPPSAGIANPAVQELRPVLEWKTKITFLKEVPAETGLSYGHAFRTERPSLIATIPVGYGDGLQRHLSNNAEFLVRGTRCPQVGRITMDQSLIDVTALRGTVELSDEVVLIGRQGDEQITVEELAQRLDTINYEVVTAISRRVPRVLERGDGALETGSVGLDHADGRCARG